MVAIHIWLQKSFGAQEFDTRFAVSFALVSENSTYDAYFTWSAIDNLLA